MQIEEVLNVNNDVPVVHSLSDGEIVEMVLDNNKRVHEIMAVYSIKQKQLRQKPLSMKQMTLEEFFNKASCLVFSSL